MPNVCAAKFLVRMRLLRPEPVHRFADFNDAATKVKKMFDNIRLIGAFALLAMLTANNPALGDPVTQGKTVTNTATVTYQVGGVQQRALSASTSFTVERISSAQKSKDGQASPTTTGEKHPKPTTP